MKLKVFKKSLLSVNSNSLRNSCENGNEKRRTVVKDMKGKLVDKLT